ncbi:group XIIB secretory phospholipase A2-like protein isoform X2 [Takifugu rubripes]|uniref:Phospholipase A2, group XIIB n=1 Tax=Takifugu rubripes TaxID=31033 RepID=A0A674PG10_TAKRU|nr:group XIIB secretory phospholipase A2-like protein isoform X2 [Takifugu rubripes]
MLLRTVLLLLLCTSVGMCATLVSYQTVQMEQAVPVVDIAAASEDASAPEAALDPELGSDPPADTHGVDNSTAGEAGEDLPAADGAGTDKDRPSGDASMLQAVTAEAAASKQPSPVMEGNGIGPGQTKSPSRPLAEDESGWSLGSIRKRFQAVHGYFDSLVELAGGQNGVCQYRCRHGELPQPRPGYQSSEPDGCGSSIMGFQLDLGIPAMTQCCNELDVCYGTCGTNKNDCDSEFRLCLGSICKDINKSLGFASEVKACSSAADALHNTVATLGCRSYMNSQRAACVCSEEERDEL